MKVAERFVKVHEIEPWNPSLYPSMEESLRILKNIIKVRVDTEQILGGLVEEASLKDQTILSGTIPLAAPILDIDSILNKDFVRSFDDMAISRVSLEDAKYLLIYLSDRVYVKTRNNLIIVSPAISWINKHFISTITSGASSALAISLG